MQFNRRSGTVAYAVVGQGCRPIGSSNMEGILSGIAAKSVKADQPLRLTAPALRFFATSRPLQLARQVNAVVRPLSREATVIAFKCTGCPKTFSVKDEFAGRKTKCPNCGTPLLVPASASPVASVPVSL